MNESINQSIRMNLSINECAYVDALLWSNAEASAFCHKFLFLICFQDENRRREPSFDGLCNAWGAKIRLVRLEEQ